MAPLLDDEEVTLGTAGVMIVEENKARGIKCLKPDPWRRLRQEDSMGKRTNNEQNNRKQQRRDADKARQSAAALSTSQRAPRLCLHYVFS